MEAALIAAQASAWREAKEALVTPFYSAIAPLLVQLDAEAWPTLAQLNHLAQRQSLCNANGVPIRFVVTDAGARSSAMAYEQRIATQGEIPTRDNWHDLFNALQWLAFPRLKAALNAGHVRETARPAGSTQRSAARDLLTQFDESGAIVASRNPDLLRLLREFRWHELFVERRREVQQQMCFVLIGHGLLEKARQPFIGLTAKALLIHLGEWPPSDSALDEAAAAWLGDTANLAPRRALAPLPLLGIPGWWCANEEASFYANPDYFRAGFQRRSTGR